MLSSLTLTPAKGSTRPDLAVEFPTDGKRPVSAVLTGPSGSGKSTCVAVLVALLTGDAIPGAVVEGTTAGGRVLSVGPTRRKIDGAVYTAAADYRMALAALGLDLHPDLVALVVDAATLPGLYAAGVEGRRKLATTLRLALPDVDRSAVLARLMGLLPLRAEAPTDMKAALASQRAANAAASEAKGAATAYRSQLAALGDCPAVPSVADVQAAADFVAAFDAWARYDTAGARWTAHDEALAAWRQRAPGEPPAYDGEAHQAARMLVERLRKEAAAEAQRVAVEAAEERARVQAEERAAETAARVEAPAAEPPPAPPPPPVLFAAPTPDTTAKGVSLVVTTILGTHALRYSGSRPTHLDNRRIADVKEPA